MNRPTPARRAASKRSAAERFRAEIEAALADGSSADEMTLRLTRTDVDHLKRDNAIPVSDISFASGEMRFLGVRIEPGGVDASRLARE